MTVMQFMKILMQLNVSFFSLRCFLVCLKKIVLRKFDFPHKLMKVFDIFHN